MRRILLASACLGVLLFAGTSTALARGPHHGPPAVRHGQFRGPQNGWQQSGYRGGYRPNCAPRRRVVGYPAYPAPVYGNVPQLGFGLAGRNFSFWLQR